MKLHSWYIIRSTFQKNLSFYDSLNQLLLSFVGHFSKQFLYVNVKKQVSKTQSIHLDKTVLLGTGILFPAVPVKKQFPENKRYPDRITAAAVIRFFLPVAG